MKPKKKKAMPTKLRRFVMSILIIAAATLGWSWVQKNQRGGITMGLSQACTLQNACIVYSRRNQETFPDSLEELVGTQVISQEEFAELTQDIKWRYFGKGRKSTDPDFVIAMSAEPILNNVTGTKTYLKIHSHVGVTMEENASIEEAMPPVK
ncbi:hypothetical protein [Prosthecobacter vanneervenii]|nr:hypothetical protein [Prosthecobacter vanneervenii]